MGASIGVTGARLGVDATGKPYAAGGRYGLYFRKRLGPGRSGPTEPALSAEKPVSPPNDSVLSAQGGPAPRTRRLWLLVALTLLMALLVGAWLAHAGDQARVDLFDASGRRTGYAVVDRDTGRVDYLDAQSRRTGWGRVDATGRVERFGLDGTRQEPTALPVFPQPKKEPRR